MSESERIKNLVDRAVTILSNRTELTEASCKRYAQLIYQRVIQIHDTTAMIEIFNTAFDEALRLSNFYHEQFGESINEQLPAS